MALLRSLTLAFLAVLIASGTQARAQTAPLKLVVPFAVGGSTDVVARLVADQLSGKLGRAVVVENRTGSGVLVGTQAVAQAAPDGNTVLFTTVAHAINPALSGQLPYDSEKDFVPVAQVANVPMVLAVHPAVPVNNLQEFLEHLRKNPGRVNFGSAGIGSALHMAVELMKHQARVEAVHVPYRGAAPAMNDLIAGHVQFIIDPISTAGPHIEGGRIRALAVSTARRSPALPNVPTFKESGMADYEASTWNVILAPKGVSAAFVDTLNKAVNEALADPLVQERLAKMSVEPLGGSTPASTGAFMAAETEKWTTIIRSANIKPEGRQ